jgi:hypothetical protein
MAHDLQGTPDPGMASLVGGIVNDVQVLIKQELALVKREVTDELHKAKEVVILLGIGLGSAALGSILLIFMLVHLLHWASSERLPLWSCYGIVGAAVMILAGILLFLGKRRAGDVRLMPEQTIATMKDNVAWIKNLTLARNGQRKSATTSTKHVAN